MNRERLPNEETSSRGVEQAASRIAFGKEVERMYELISLQVLPVADSVVTDEVAGLRRKHRRSGGGGGGKTNACLISLQNVLNGADILNILGGGFGL